MYVCTVCSRRREGVEWVPMGERMGKKYYKYSSLYFLLFRNSHGVEPVVASAVK